MEPQSDELGVWYSFLAGNSFYHGKIKWIQPKGDRLTRGARDSENLSLVQEVFSLVRALVGNGFIPFMGFFQKIFCHFLGERWLKFYSYIQK